MATIKINTVKSDVVVPIGMHSSYFRLVKNTLVVLLDRQTDPKQALVNAVGDTEMTLDESIVKIFMALLKEVEKSATDNDLLEEVDVEIPDEN